MCLISFALHNLDKSRLKRSCLKGYVKANFDYVKKIGYVKNELLSEMSNAVYVYIYTI